MHKLLKHNDNTPLIFYFFSTIVIGFDEKEVQSGQGLKNMKKRVNELKAYFSLVSKPDEGTTVVIKVKL